MTRLDDPFAPGVTSSVRGDHALRRDHVDPVDIGFDRHCRERPAPRHAVTIGVEPHGLILIDLGRGRHERVKGMGRQRQRRLFILFEQFPDRLGLARHTVVQPGQGAPPQRRVELGQILYCRDRRRPVSLEIVDAVFHIGLLVAPRRHTEAGIEAIVTGQGLVPPMQLTLAAFQNRRRHGLGIIPPDLPGHAPEERQALDHAGQDRFGAFARQRHGEAKATVAPRQQQDRDQLTPLREVHVDVPEIPLQPPAGRMRQGNERLAVVSTVPGDVAADLIVTAHVALFLA